MQPPAIDRTTRHVGAGLTMVVVVLVFAFGGIWLDRKTGLGPAFLLTGLVLGCIGGFIHLVQSIAPELLPFRPRRQRERPPKDRMGGDAS